MKSLSYSDYWQELRAKIQRHQTAGERVVFTNGCFDLLHKGHLDSLCRSRREGDLLIVGLNSDMSVKMLKGPHRPVQSQDIRAAALLELPDVFAVAVFDEKTPLDLIACLKPDIITKGGDYRKEDVVGADLVDEVIIFPLLEGFSTTESIRKLKQNI